MTNAKKPNGNGWARTLNLFNIDTGGEDLPAWTEVPTGSDDIGSETVFDHLATIEDKIRARLGELGLGSAVSPNGLFEVMPFGRHKTSGLNTYSCSLLITPGLGVVQPLISIVSVGEGVYVDVIEISNAIVAETQRICARRERHAKKYAQTRQAALNAVEKAAEEGLVMELMAVQATAYEAEYLVEGEDLFEVIMLMLDERDDRIEMGRRRMNVDDPAEFARRLRTLVIPEQRLLARRRAQDASASSTLPSD